MMNPIPIGSLIAAGAVESVAEDLLIGWMFSNMSNSMKWVFIIVILAAIVVGLIFFIRTINKIEDSVSKNKEDDEKEF